jgi:hypothetical protein
VALTSQVLGSIFPALVSLPWSVFIFREQRESISIHCIQTHIYSSSREINRMNSDLQLRRDGSVESVGRGGG